MILSDKDIRSAQRNHKLIEPFVDANVQPASVDLTLGDEILYRREVCGLCEGGWTHERYPADCANNLEWASFTKSLSENPWYALHPDEFVLATTFETVNVSPQLVAQVNGKSSWARKGLLVHTTAGFIDPGFRGQVTLELKNLGHEPIELHSGVRICQIVFSTLSSRAEFPYGSPGLGSHYQNQEGPQESAL